MRGWDFGQDNSYYSHQILRCLLFDFDDLLIKLLEKWREVICFDFELMCLLLLKSIHRIS